MDKNAKFPYLSPYTSPRIKKNEFCLLKLEKWPTKNVRLKDHFQLFIIYGSVYSLKYGYFMLSIYLNDIFLVFQNVFFT